LSFIWIPGHSNIKRNYKADKEAKIASDLNNIPLIQTTNKLPKKVAPKLKKLKKLKTQYSVAQSFIEKKRSMHSSQTTDRTYQVNPRRLTSVKTCRLKITVKHFLTECRKYSKEQ